jgi:hypothetical protein
MISAATFTLNYPLTGKYPCNIVVSVKSIKIQPQKEELLSFWRICRTLVYMTVTAYTDGRCDIRSGDAVRPDHIFTAVCAHGLIPRGRNRIRTVAIPNFVCSQTLISSTRQGIH